jgi:hypothetical protein
MKKTDIQIFSFLVVCIILLGIGSALQTIHIKFEPRPSGTSSPTPQATSTISYIPQFVLISFDGSKSIQIWEDIHKLKEEIKASSTPITVTHFINTAYFLTNETRNQYQGPGEAVGKTNIGIAEGVDDIHARINEVNRAVAEGDEIAVHTVGHFSGLHWKQNEWNQELVDFDKILFGLDAMYPTASLPKLNLKPEDIIGFRAPYLDHDANLYVALHKLPNYRYDSSEVVRYADTWPKKDASGLWHIPLGTMTIGKNNSQILAMDYNLYFRDSKAKDTIKKGTPEWTQIYEDTLNAFRGYFNKNYTHNRAPVLVGYHFEKWNDGVYWEAMKTFAKETCGKPEVECGTFKDLVTYLDMHGAPVAVTEAEALTASVADAANTRDLLEPQLVEGERNE